MTESKKDINKYTEAYRNIINSKDLLFVDYYILTNNACEELHHNNNISTVSDCRYVEYYNKLIIYMCEDRAASGSSYKFVHLTAHDMNYDKHTNIYKLFTHQFEQKGYESSNTFSIEIQDQ